MDTIINAILIHEDDSVVTVTTAIKKGSVVAFKEVDSVIELNVVEDIPVFHKVAVSDIKKGASVYKYGQLIGKAIVDIPRGSHIHDHNIQSPDK
jgi:altronate dehydratase small subunit